uniref:Uncharacterized protein n=2 Tax=Gloeothece TaxID=28070 RepID=E0UGE9_GLOV7|nr:hypothetical protein Cyan7822_4877 [Gloeothece verrucosa PCC 7822]
MTSSNDSDSDIKKLPVNTDEIQIEKLAVNTDDNDLTVQSKKVRIQTASYLAITLWVILAVVVVAHIAATIWISIDPDWYLKPSLTGSIDINSIEPETLNKLIELQKLQKESLASANTILNESAKTIYTFLGTLVTGVTGYYFTKVEEKGD